MFFSALSHFIFFAQKPHGTAVAGIAAGRGGVAPEASLIIVRVGERGRASFARTTEIMRALKYVIEKAIALNMPISINLSFGMNDGSHDGTSLFETYIDEMIQKWKTVFAVAAGNEGSAGHHYAGTVERGEVKDVEFVVSNTPPSLFVALWKNFVDVFTFELIAPNGKSTGIVGHAERSVVMKIDGISIYLLYGQPSHYSEDQEIFFQMQAATSVELEGFWKIRITGIQVVDGRFNMWLPTVEEVSDQTAFFQPEVLVTLTLPSTARNVVTVGGYNHRVNSIAEFSGRGFTRNNSSVKPDLVAPGTDILSSSTFGGYDSFTGTSMAAPFVAGSAALMMEWGIVRGNDPFLFGQRVKAFLKIGTNKNRGVDFPNPEWGYGMLCLRDSMDYLVDYTNGIQAMESETPEESPPVQAPITSIEELPMNEFVILPNVVAFYTYYDSSFREYVRDKPFIRIGTILAGEYVICYVEESRMNQIVEDLDGGYQRIFPQVCGLMDSISLDHAGVISIHHQPYLNLRGAGVLLGIIDTGIDYTKDAFRYEDGTSKIKYIWDQTLTGTIPINPPDMHFGAEFTQEEINEALNSENPFDIVPHKDTVGHGTFLASIAGGREDNRYVGAAPDSEIIMVKLKKAKRYYLDKYLVPTAQENAYESSNILLGVNYIMAKGLELNRPVAICIGLGTNLGGHTGTGLFEEYLSLISQKTHTCLCTPAGNESNAKHHTQGHIEKTGDTASIEVKSGEGAESLSVYFWYSGYDRMGVTVKSPTDEIVGRMPIRGGSSYRRKLALENSEVVVEYYLGESNSSVVKVITPTPGIWTITLQGEIILDGEFHAWMPITGFIDPSVEFLAPTPNYTIVSPSTSFGTITCGAFNSFNNSLYISSSWGPTRLPRISPDLVAPGVNVGGVYPTGYGTMTGTSVAAAITTGAAALMLQWGIVNGNDMLMNTYRLRTYLVRGCSRTDGVSYPNNQWGYGKLDLAETFNLLKRM